VLPLRGRVREVRISLSRLRFNMAQSGQLPWTTAASFLGSAYFARLWADW
jgi:hypothetical protein